MLVTSAEREVEPSIRRIFVVHYNGCLWEILIFLHLFLNELLKSLLLFNNQLVLISLHHIRVKISPKYILLLFLSPGKMAEATGMEDQQSIEGVTDS